MKGLFTLLLCFLFFPGFAAKPKHQYVRIKTDMGDCVIMLYNETPLHRDNFIKLTKNKTYDGTLFHRIIKSFMIQGGDPLTKDDNQAAMWGTGGPGYKFEDEIGPDNNNEEGTISMANSGPNTNGSQFFINVNNNNFLDTKHTVFGKVTEGMDVVTAIEMTPTTPSDRPLEPVVINSITIA